MQPDSYPYGPPPKRLEVLLQALSKQRGREISTNVMKDVGVPESVATIDLVGLKLLGFIDPDGKLTPAVKAFLSDRHRSEVSRQIIDRVYATLRDIATTDPSQWREKCDAHLAGQGKGESARRKILTLFEHFMKLQSTRPHLAFQLALTVPPVTQTVVNQPAETVPQADELPSRHAEAPIQSMAVPTPTPSTTLEADVAARKLAESLEQFVEARRTALIAVERELERLTQERALLADELAGTEVLLSQHLSRYPGLRNRS